MAHNGTAQAPPAALELMRQLAEKAAPEECCGALLGSTDFASWWRIDDVREIDNQAADRRRAYLISPDTVRELERAAMAAGRDLIGFFHSHPASDAEPSATDIRLAWPGYLYVIVALDQVKAWTLNHEHPRFDAVPFQIA
jgi:proteasome lid subunit RPN8/RPN11